MEASHGSRVIPSIDILPRNSIVATPQDIFVNTGQTATEGIGPPLTVADHLELHAAANRLSNTKGAFEGLHAEGLLGGLPSLEAGLERVGRDRLVGGGVEGGDADAVSESVVDARGRGGGGGVRGVSEGSGVGARGNNAHRLEREKEKVKL